MLHLYFYSTGFALGRHGDLPGRRKLHRKLRENPNFNLTFSQAMSAWRHFFWA
jgi:hypothetical protein